MKARLLALVLATSAGVAQQASHDGAKALALENSREWAKARAEYNEILSRQPDNVDAKAGKMRVSEVIVAELQLEKCIAEAERLMAAANFQAAVRVFNQAMAVLPSYLSRDRFQAMRAKLMEQNTPVEVTLNSDGQTWVLIENFRGPRKLEGETIKMMPGNYRVIGRRNGYHDIEQTLMVRGGVPLAITVECNIQASVGATTRDSNEQTRFEREYQQTLNARRLEEIRAKAKFEEELESIRQSYLPTEPVIKAEV
jgi:hypothetical protein